MKHFRKYKEIIQDSKQYIKDLKSELLNIEHCESTGTSMVFYIISNKYHIFIYFL